MKDEQFDKEITTLYQQRKSQIIAPEVTLSEPSTKAKYSVFKVLSTFIFGGIASFGIMAIASYLAKKPEELQQIQYTKHQVKIADIASIEKNDEIIIPKPELPTKPEKPVVQIKKDLLVPLNSKAHVNNVDSFELSMVQIVNLPQLKEPKLFVKPVYKVMPKYTSNTLKGTHSAAVRLRYEIDEYGNVKNIDVVSNNASRELQRSAKKALAKWKYNPDDNVQRNYEIIFEFSGAK
jgi:protein TonB